MYILLALTHSLHCLELDVKRTRSISFGSTNLRSEHPLTRSQAGMTTFMAINLGKEMKLRKKEKQALVLERSMLAKEKAKQSIKKLKEQKIELEKSFEFGLRQQAKRMERLLRLLEVAENQADWLAREGFAERADAMREDEVSVAAAIVEKERVKITEERKTMTENFKAEVETLNKRLAKQKRHDGDF